MRNRKPARSLLFPGLRQRLLATLLLHPKKEWYLSELVGHLAAAQAHLHRELALLVKGGILRRRVEGRQVYYSPDPACPYLAELTALLRKTMGIHQVLSRALASKRDRICCAFLFGSVAKGQENAESDVDVMIVGDVTMVELLPALRKAEKEIGRAVNPTIYPAKELAEKNSQGHHFVRAVLVDPTKAFLIGDGDELEKAALGRTAEAPQDKQIRTRRATRRRSG